MALIDFILAHKATTRVKLTFIDPVSDECPSQTRLYFKRPSVDAKVFPFQNLIALFAMVFADFSN